MKLTAFATWGLWDSNPIFFRDPNKKTLRFYFALRGGRGQGSPLFKHYLLATPLTEKEDVVSCLSAFSLSFFLTVANSRSFVCPSLRPPFYFIVVVGPSALLDLSSRTFSMKEDKVYASQKARADSVHQFLAGSLRKKELFFTQFSVIFNLERPAFFPVPALGTLTSTRRERRHSHPLKEGVQSACVSAFQRS